MKKITIFLISFFTVFSMMAQLQLESPFHRFGDLPEASSRSSIVLYDQLLTPIGGTASQVFTDFSNCELQTADDFIVPAGGWTITDVDATGTWSYGPQPYPFTVIFYADASGMPGAVIDSIVNNTYLDNAGIAQIALSTPITLSAGHYWISVMIEMPHGGGNPGQWFWAALDGLPAINELSMFQDPCGLIGGPPTWAPTSVVIGSQYTQASFALYGHPPMIPVSNWAIILGVLLIGTFIVVRYRRTLA